MTTLVGIICLGALGSILGVLLLKAVALASNGFGATMESNWAKQKATIGVIEAGLQRDEHGLAATVFMVWHLWSAIFYSVACLMTFTVFVPLYQAIDSGRYGWVQLVFAPSALVWGVFYGFRVLRSAWYLSWVYRAHWPDLHKGILDKSWLSWPLR
jgi:hypothetical protein